MQAHILTLFLFYFFCSINTYVVAQDTVLGQDEEILLGSDPPTEIEQAFANMDMSKINPRTKHDLARELSFFVLGFGILVMALLVYIIRCSHIEKDNIVRVLMVTLIIISTLFLITAGYDNNQIAPAMGLLGTIAGYLLGRSNSQSRNS